MLLKVSVIIIFRYDKNNVFVNIYIDINRLRGWAGAGRGLGGGGDLVRRFIIHQIAKITRA